VLVPGKAGSAGTANGVLPVLGEESVVATVQPLGRKEIATAVVGDRERIFARTGHQLTGRTATDQAEVLRLHAERTSFWLDRRDASTAVTVAGIGASS
jgi:hypothetical protein